MTPDLTIAFTALDKAALTKSSVFLSSTGAIPAASFTILAFVSATEAVKALLSSIPEVINLLVSRAFHFDNVSLIKWCKSKLE